MSQRKGAAAVADPVTEYAHDVLEGRIVAGRLVRLACERHLRDLRVGAARGLHFDPERAQMAIDIAGLMPQRKGEWQGLPLALEAWQKFRVGSVFGWLRRDGTRRFRKAWNEVARKNGKTTEAAGITNILAWFDDEPGSEVYVAATKRDQARICWSEAKWQMTYSEPGAGRSSLAAEMGVTALTANMHSVATASKMEPLGADENSGDGINPHRENRVRPTENFTPPLTPGQRLAVFQPRFARNGRGAPEEGIAGPITAEAGRTGKGDSAQVVFGYVPERCGTLSADMSTGQGAMFSDHVIAPLLRPRRLTPTECERLQGFPDGWTAEQADSHRYRQLGNAVAVPVAEWIARRMAAVATC